MNKKRNNSKNPYTQIQNIILQDNRLTLKARGLFVYMWSLPDDWNFTEESLAKKLVEGRKAVRSAIQELIQFGYLYREQEKSNTGKFITTTIYQLFENPVDNDYFSDMPLGNIGTVVPLRDIPKGDSNKNKIPTKENKRDILSITKDVENIFDSFVCVLDKDKQRLINKSRDEVIRRIVFNLDKSVKNVKRYTTTTIENELKKLYGLEEIKKFNTSQKQILTETNMKNFTEEEKAIAQYDWVSTLGEDEEMI